MNKEQAARQRVAEMLEKRFPGRTVEQRSKLLEAWAAEVCQDGAAIDFHLIHNSDAYVDFVVEKLARLHPELTSPIPSAADLLQHLEEVQRKQIGRGFSGQQSELELRRQLENMTEQERHEHALSIGFYKAAKPAEPAPEPTVTATPAEPEKAASAKPKAFSAMDAFERRDEIAKRLGRDASTLLASDVARFTAAILKEEGGSPTPPRGDTPARGGSAKNATFATLAGMRTDSDEFRALSPQRRLELAREAAKGGK